MGPESDMIETHTHTHTHTHFDVTYCEQPPGLQAVGDTAVDHKPCPLGFARE